MANRFQPKHVALCFLNIDLMVRSLITAIIRQRRWATLKVFAIFRVQVFVGGLPLPLPAKTRDNILD